MREPPAPPTGFARRETEAGSLYGAASDLDALVEAGLGRPEGWPAGGVGGAGIGRGAVAVVETPAGRCFLKRMRRGGMLGPWRGDRFFRADRLLDNLVVPAAAIARGVSTPRAIALRLERSGGGSWLAWLALEHLDGGRSLASLLRDGAPEVRQLDAAMRAVRRAHEAGLRHPDLNLGNLVVRRGPSEVEGYVVDLDRARLTGRPLPFGRRARELRRLERSYAKLFRREARGAADGSLDFYRAYAAGDEVLERRLESARRAWRWTLRWRMLAWRIAGR